MHCVTIITNLLFIIYFARSYAWRVVPAHQASYAERAQDVGVSDGYTDDGEEFLPRSTSITILPTQIIEIRDTNILLRYLWTLYFTTDFKKGGGSQFDDSLHTVYKFGWCKSDATARSNMIRSTNYSIPHRFAAQSKWVYILDAENLRKFRLQCVVVKVYVPEKYQFKRTRIPFHYCQGSVIYLMMRTVGKILIHEFYFMALFYMPATFVFEYYQPIYM